MAIRRRLNEDLYLNFAAMQDGKATIQAYAFPLVCWIWVWGFVLIFGFSYAARDVVTPLIIVHCFGARNLTQIYGVLMLTILIGPLGAIYAGWTHDQTGSYAIAFTALAALNATAFALLFLVRDERGRRAD